jgi:zinc and cadmium transporter
MPIVAGGFIYMAGTDLLPELHKEKRLKKSAMQFIFMLLGLLLMYLFKVFF